MGPDWEERLLFGEIRPIVDQMAFNFFAAGVLAIEAKKIDGREGKLPIDMEDSFAFSLTLSFLSAYGGFLGLLPSELALLTSLETLGFGGTHIFGSIPSEFGKLTKLLTIDLGNTKLLVGSISSEIGLLTNLTSLELDNNKLDGTIPSEIGLMTSLTLLDLGNNNLQGSLPIEIENLTNLERLLY